MNWSVRETNGETIFGSRAPHLCAVYSSPALRVNNHGNVHEEGEETQRNGEASRDCRSGM
ncbi:hypothetical protein EYF80_009410 [Liparis tanakae]|uniref:Uncharacterized protein n=1 Tax=Liparis tanakae TaxID=230148 RepID=A0A4Z2IRB0_9TELE|nr:hypothetical protein EYF80_009410 [Liparis tanakae]